MSLISRTLLAMFISCFALFVTKVDNATPYSSCVSATIGGQHKCLARGQFCSLKYKVQYPKYGFHCVKVKARGRLK